MPTSSLIDMEEATCERIINALDMVIKKDHLLDEFDILYSPGDVNKSPVVHVEHKLALESWCVKYVYHYAYSSLINSNSLRGHLSLCQKTQLCLLLMPEVTTFWNTRKRLIVKSLLTISEDFTLTKLVLTRKPKCIEAFQHRRWLFERLFLNVQGEQSDIILNNYHPLLNQLRQSFIDELELCIATANKKQNNYHSWNHRLWVIDKLAKCAEVTEVYKNEYDSCHEWVSFHISEHSGLHYFMELLEKICSAAEKRHIKLEDIKSDVKTITELYEFELDFNRKLILAYPGHESLFCQRRVILLKLYNIAGHSKRKGSPPPLALKRSCVESINSKWTDVYKREQRFIIDCSGELQQKLAIQQHGLWFNNTLSL